MKGGTWVTVPLSVAFFASGYWFGLRLSAIPDIHVFKLMNIIGLACDLAGIAILSKFIMSSGKAKAFIVDKMTPQLLNLFAGVPTGMIAASVLGPAAPSQLAVRDFSIALQFTLVFPVLLHTIFWAREKNLAPAVRELRVTVIGSFFLGFGLLIQLVAAFQDLYAK